MAGKLIMPASTTSSVPSAGGVEVVALGSLVMIGTMILLGLGTGAIAGRSCREAGLVPGVEGGDDGVPPVRAGGTAEDGPALVRVLSASSERRSASWRLASAAASAGGAGTGG